MGSGSTLKVAKELGRKCVGYDINIELLPIVKEKLGITQTKLFEASPEFEIIIRNDVKHLRTQLQHRVEQKRRKRRRR